MRRIGLIVFLICILLCRLVFVEIDVGAESPTGTSVSLVPSQAYVEAGENIVFDAVLANNSEILGLEFQIAFEEESLEFVSSEVKTASGVSYIELTKAGELFYSNLSNALILNGTLFSLTFKAKASTVLIKKTLLDIVKTEGDEPVAGDSNGFEVDCDFYGTKIAIRDPGKLAFAGANYVYDGTQKEITVTGANPYYDSEDTIEVSTTYTNNVGTNAGTYNASAKVSFTWAFATISDITLNSTLQIDKKSQPAPNTGDAVINYIDETITFGEELEANYIESFIGNYIISGSGIQPSTTIYLRHKGDSNHIPGDALAISIPARPIAPVSPTMKSKTATSITLDTLAGIEYKCNEGSWQDSPVFAALNAAEQYTFYARRKASLDMFKSNSSAGSFYITHPHSIIISGISVDEQDKTITVTFENYLGYNIASALAFASVYSEGKLIGLKKNNIMNLLNDFSTTEEFIFGGDTELSSFKIFVWDSFGGLRPLSKFYREGN